MKHPRLFSKKQQQCIWARQNGRCGYCGCSMQDNQALYHHVLRYNDNGATNLENGVMLCEVCHVFVHHAGHYTTEIMLPRTEYKYANWQENKNYSLYLKNELHQQEITDDRTVHSNQLLHDIDEYWNKLKNTEKASKKYNPTSLGVNNMASTNYAYQIDLLNQLKSFLGQFQERLKIESNNYKNKVDELHGEGLMDETYRDFVEQQLEPTRDQIKKLIEHIENEDIPAVEKAIRDIEPFL